MSLMDEPDEVLDLVDEDDKVLGTILREDVMKLVAGVPGLVRAADAFIVNDQGQLWVPRRQPHKKIAPNGLDFSAGEHVQSGETYQDAIVRGFNEELGMTIKPQALQTVGKLRRPGSIPYMQTLFVYHSNRVPAYNKEDFVSYEWLMPSVLVQRLEAGEKSKAHLLDATKLLLSKQ